MVIKNVTDTRYYVPYGMLLLQSNNFKIAQFYMIALVSETMNTLLIFNKLSWQA